VLLRANQIVDKPLIPRPSFGAQKPGAPLVEPSPDEKSLTVWLVLFTRWISSCGFVEKKKGVEGEKGRLNRSKNEQKGDFASRKCAKRIPVSQVSISPEKAPIKESSVVIHIHLNFS